MFCPRIFCKSPLFVTGKTDKITELLLQGYDHILDVVDEEGVPIADVVAQRGDDEMKKLLASIPSFEVISLL